MKFSLLPAEAMEQEDQEVLEEQMPWNMVLANEERPASRPSSRTKSPTSDVSAESGFGDIGGSSPYSSESSTGASPSSSGLSPSRSFDRAPGPPRSRNESENERTNRQWRPFGMDEPTPPAPITIEKSWSPWDGSHWSPFQIYPWQPIDRSPFSFRVDNNDSLYTTNEAVGNNNRPPSQCSEISSTVSTLETTWPSSEEEEAVEEPKPLPRVPPVHWLHGYIRSRGGVGFLFGAEVMEQIKAWKDLEPGDIEEELTVKRRKLY